MGIVHRVHHRDWAIDLAVKSPLTLEAEARERFLREARTWIDLDPHPNVVSCYYAQTIDGVPRLFAELVAGTTLHHWIAERRLYEGGEHAALVRILDVAVQIAWGLGFAHDRGVVHRDVKPRNVLMTLDGVPKVADFGIANAAAGATGRTRTRAGGTAAYAAPEQVRGEVATVAADVWAWGVTVLEMFVGELAWLTALAASSHLDPHADRVATPPAAVVELLRRCLSTDPAGRPASMHDVLDVLHAVYADIAGQTYPRAEPSAAALIADGLNNKGASLFDIDTVDGAMDAWDRALAADPHHVEASFNRGMVAWDRGEITDLELLERLGEARRTHPTSERAARSIAFVDARRRESLRASRPVEDGLAPACVRSFDEPGEVVDATFARDGSLVVAAVQHGYHVHVASWELATMEPRRATVTTSYKYIRCLRASFDGRKQRMYL
jgi:hypothetical protein